MRFRDFMQGFVIVLTLTIILLLFGVVFNHQAIYGIQSDSALLFFGYPVNAHVVLEISYIMLVLASLIPLLAIPFIFILIKKKNKPNF